MPRTVSHFFATGPSACSGGAPRRELVDDHPLRALRHELVRKRFCADLDFAALPRGGRDLSPRAVSRCRGGWFGGLRPRAVRRQSVLHDGGHRLPGRARAPDRDRSRTGGSPMGHGRPTPAFPTRYARWSSGSWNPSTRRVSRCSPVPRSARPISSPTPGPDAAVRAAQAEVCRDADRGQAAGRSRAWGVANLLDRRFARLVYDVYDVPERYALSNRTAGT